MKSLKTSKNGIWMKNKTKIIKKKKKLWDNKKKKKKKVSATHDGDRRKAQKTNAFKCEQELHSAVITEKGNKNVR